MKTFSLTVSCFASTYLSHCFSCLFTFLYSKSFQNNQVHHVIINCHFNIFFCGITTEKRKLEKCFFGCQNSNQYTGLPNGLDMLLIILLFSFLTNNKVKQKMIFLALQAFFCDTRCVFWYQMTLLCPIFCMYLFFFQNQQFLSYIYELDFQW